MEDLRLIVFDNCKELGEKVNKHLQKMLDSKENFIASMDEVRFNNGEGKVVIKDSIRNKDVFMLSDVGNHSVTYEMYGYKNHKSPDDHFMDIMRCICAIRGQAKRVSLVMPLLYSSRQHKRDGRESLDCAMALQYIVSQNVENIITFDVHDANVQNAIPYSSFDNFYPTNIILEEFINNESVNRENLMAISPDNGAMKRTSFYANMLGIQVGGHFEKQRDVYNVVDGKNPILKHEYIGRDVAGKDLIIVDDMIASGESMLDVASSLKKLGANNIYLMSAYSLFTKGIEVFDEAYKKGLFTKVYTTNLSYVNNEARESEWLYEVDCSKYIARVLYAYYMQRSVSPIMDYRSPELQDFSKGIGRSLHK